VSGPGPPEPFQAPVVLVLIDFPGRAADKESVREALRFQTDQDFWTDPEAWKRGVEGKQVRKAIREIQSSEGNQAPEIIRKDPRMVQNERHGIPRQAAIGREETDGFSG
jgi:hypothetical protein